MSNFSFANCKIIIHERNVFKFKELKKDYPNLKIKARKSKIFLIFEKIEQAIEFFENNKEKRKISFASVKDFLFYSKFSEFKFLFFFL